MTLLNPTRTPYLFDKDLAVHVVFAEVKHFAAEAGIHGPSGFEIQTLTRRLSWLVDRDLDWTDIDVLAADARELRTIDSGTHPDLQVNTAGTVDNTDHLRGGLLIGLFWEITTILGTVRTRWEESA